MLNKKFFLLIVFLLVQVSGWSQRDTVDLSTARKCLEAGVSAMESDDYMLARSFFARGMQFDDADSVVIRHCKYYTAASYYYQGKNTEMLGFYQESYAFYEEALKLFQQMGEKSDILLLYRRLAEISSYAFSRYDRSLQQYRKAYALAVEMGDEILQVQLLSEIIKKCEMLERWSEKNQMVAAIDSICEVHADNKRILLEMYVILGDEAMKSGQMNEARIFYKRALNEARFDTDKNSVYLIYSKLRGLELDDKKYDAAYEYSKYCVAEYAKLFKNNSVQRYIPYILQAEICARANRREECFQSADSLFQALNYGLDALGRAQMYLYKGMWHSRFKEYDAAKENFDVVQSILDTMNIQNVFNDKLNVLALKGHCLFDQQKYEEARELYLQYLSLSDRMLGKESRDYIRALEFVANIDGFTGDMDEGAKCLEEAMQIKMSKARADIQVMPSSVRERHWNAVSGSMWHMAGFAIDAHIHQNDFVGKAYNALLFSKGLLLASEKSMASEIKALGDSALLAQYGKLLRFQREMTVAESKGNQKEATRCFSEMNKIDRDLTVELLRRGVQISLNDVTYPELEKKLQKGEVIVDFTDFTQKDGPHRYVAYLLAKGWKYPKLVEVTTQHKIDSLLHTIDGRLERLYEPAPSRELLKILWEPLVKEMPKVKTVYYVPSGILHQIALESIAVKNKKILGDQYRFVRLSSAKELLQYRSHRRVNKLESAVLYGGLDYDMESEEMVAQSLRYKLSDDYAFRSAAKLKGSSTFQKIGFSKDEVIAIEKILTLKDVKVQSYMGKTGTEESFLHLSGKAPQVLQMSTHGFYYTPEEAQSLKALSGYKDIMYLTGLVMAGGNAEWKGTVLPEGVHGGLLTSDDISRLDLQRVELAVLSACETGRGKVTNEGLYGLQRAFKKAGAQTLVMSLWKVSDRATKDFMIAFYRHLSENKWDKRDAFRKAKRDMRRKYKEPIYWAGFVIVD